MSAKTRILKLWMGMLLLTILLLPMATVSVLYVAPVQEAVGGWIAAWLSERMGMEITVGSVRLQYPLKIEMREVHAGTLLGIESIETDIRLRPLTRGVIKSDYVSMRGLKIHTDTTDGAVQIDLMAQRFRIDDISYRWREREVQIRHVLVADGHVSVYREDTGIPSGRTPDSIPLTLRVAGVRLHQIGGEYTDTHTRLRAVADDIKACDMVAGTTMQLSLGIVELQEATLCLRLDGMPPWELANLSAHADSLRYHATGGAGRISRLAFEESHGIALREGTMAIDWHDGVLGIPHFAFRTDYSSLSGHLRTLSDSTGEMSIDGYIDATVGYADAIGIVKWMGDTSGELAHLYPTETLSISMAIDGTMEQLRLTRCDVSLPTTFDLSMEGILQGIATPRRCVAQCRIEAKTYDIGFLTALTDSTTRNRLIIPKGMALQGTLYYAPDTLYTLCLLNIAEGTATIEAGYRPANEAYHLSVHTDSLDLRQFAPEGELGRVNMEIDLHGNRPDHTLEESSIYGMLQLHTLQWKEHTLSNATARLSVTGKQLRAEASYSDSLMKWSLTSIAKYTPETIEAQLYVQLDDLDMKALQIADTDIRPTLRCHTTLRIDSDTTYSLHAHFGDIVLSTATQRIHPRPIDLQSMLTADTALLAISSGDLMLTAHAHTEGLPWQWDKKATATRDGRPDNLSSLRAILSAGNDNPVSNYLALMGIEFRTLHATIDERQGNITSRLEASGINAKGFGTDSAIVTAHYTDGTLHASLRTTLLTWETPQMQLRGKAGGRWEWSRTFAPDNLSGVLYLSDVQYTMPTYSLQLHSADTLSIPLQRGVLTLTALPLYTTGKHPILLDGHLSLLEGIPTMQLHLTARNTPLLHTETTSGTLLYGKAIASGGIMLSGASDALSITGDLRLHPGSSIHYIYRDAILTADNQIDNVVSFVSFHTDSATSYPKRRIATNRLSMQLNLHIDPTVELEVWLGSNGQNTVAIQGGGTMSLQYFPAEGFRLSGKYTIEDGELNMNIPLLHANHMSLREGSTITWSGNPQNPQLDIAAEERIRASVTLDGSPQSILFVTGISLTDTMDKLDIQLTLSAPENASMQNTLAALSPEERGKLAVALLTTGLYLGEGGTGKLMNTALLGIVQSQIDNLSRDAFSTVDVSVGIEPLPDGVSGMSTRTDYSFSIAKRLWNNRIRIIVGGSVTTMGERIENDAVIDNISIEWRITPIGDQYVRFFYDKNYESILEGEIRETGVGYMYRKRF